MALEDADGFIMCGVEIVFGTGEGADEEIFGELLDIRGVGATRGVQPGGHQNLELDTDSGIRWMPFLFSCIASLTPFTVVCVFKGNYDWSEIFKTIKKISFTWPIETGYTTGGKLEFNKAGVIAFDMSGSFENRAAQTFTVQPSGKPIITPGTPVA